MTNLWSQFATFDNFLLAWQRLANVTSRMITDDLGIEVFAFNLHENLHDLVEKVKDENSLYCLQPDNKVYVPKPSTTLRTMSMMCVPDLIVYQALVNVIADASHSKLVTHENQHVWGNLYAGPGSPWMLKRWKIQYNNFVNEIEKLFADGNPWIASTDIVSFYDTVDHQIMLKLVESYAGHDPRFISFVKECFSKWASHTADTSISRGIPQGSNASDYLANLYLYEIDQQMIVKGHHYVRYVDDIRILGQDKASVQQGLIDFDLELKKYGLVAQVTKTSVHKIEDIRSEITRLKFWVTDPTDASTYEDEPSLPSSEQASSVRDHIEGSKSESIDDELDFDEQESEGTTKDKITVDDNTSADSIQNQLLEQFADAFELLDDSENGKEADRQITFCLNRLFRRDEIRDKALQLLEKLPWRSESVTRYLALFKDDQEVIKTLTEFIKQHEVYFWHRANALEALAKIAGAKHVAPICREWLSDDLQEWYAKMVAAKILWQASGQHSFLVESLRREQNRAGSNLDQRVLLRQRIAYGAFQTARKKEKHQTLFDLMLHPHESTLMRRMVIFLLQQTKCKVEWGDLYTHHAILGDYADLIERLGMAPNVPRLCYIFQSVTQLFSLSLTASDLRPFYGGHYQVAVKHLRKSVESYYTTRHDDFVHNFHQFAHLTLLAFHEQVLPTVGSSPVEYGDLWQHSGFKAQTPNGNQTWEKLGELRKRTDHPIDRKTRLHTRQVQDSEVRALKAQLGIALQELFDAWVSATSSTSKTKVP